MMHWTVRDVLVSQIAVVIFALAAGFGPVHLGWGAEPAAAKPLMRLPGDYVALYEAIYAAGDPGQKTKPHPAEFGDLALHLFLRTHNALQGEAAQTYLTKALADPKILTDFHVLHHFGEYAWNMKRHGLLSPGQQETTAQLAIAQLAAFVKSDDTGDYNIRVGTVAGYAGLLKFMEGEPFEGRAAAQKKLDDYWSLIRQTGDLDEDASNYDSLGAAFLIDLARLTGHEADLQSPGFKRMFERFRDIVSPAGLIPEYGDAYFTYTDMPVDRIYLLEYAAKAFNDPTFLYAARKLYARPQTELPSLDHWTRALHLIDMDLLRGDPQTPPGPASRVMYRSRRGTDGDLADKLILRTGINPGDAMILMDLYASGSHSHPNKGPSIAYYEAGQVPLFHNMGRHHTRSAIDGNLLWAMPPDAGKFPGCWNGDNQWFTMRIPVSLLTHEGTQYSIGPRMDLRNFREMNHDTQTLWFDNLRLQGRAGTRLIDSFDSTKGWGASLLKQTKAESDTADHTQGVASQKMPWAAVPSAGFPRTFDQPPATFDAGQFDELKLDLKYAGMRPMMHIRGIGQQVDLGDQIMVAEPPTASAEQRGGDAFGQVSYAWYLRHDSSLTRRIVLTREGYLIVHDTLIPGSQMDGWNAGQLWQLYELAEHGNNWFCSEDDGAYPKAGDDLKATCSRRMLVRFGDADSIASEEVKQVYYGLNPRQRKATRFFTTFSQKKLHAGQPVDFTLVVLPIDPAGPAPAALADAITLTAQQAGVHVAITAPAAPVTVEISADRWNVRR